MVITQNFTSYLKKRASVKKGQCWLLFSSYTSMVFQTTCLTLQPISVGFTAMSTSFILVEHLSRVWQKKKKKKDLALWALIRTVQRLKLLLVIYIFNQLISLCEKPQKKKKKVVWHCGSCYANFRFQWYSTFRWGMGNPRILAVGVYSATNAKGDVSHPSLPWAQCQNNTVWDSCIFKSSLDHQLSGKFGLKPPD